MKCILLLMAVSLLLIFTYQPATKAEEKKIVKKSAKIQGANVPDHEVRYEDNLSPEWKINWDLARKLYREKKYREALVQYELLLSQKESVDEARWEYATLLIRQERWQQAGEQIEKLMVNEPDNMEYRFAMAEVNTNTGKIDPAVELYKQLYILNFETPGIIRALEGLIKALEVKGDQREVLFYLEKLIALKPDKTELQIKLARLSLESDQPEKARIVLEKLEQSMPDNLSVLQLQASLQEKLGDRDAEAAYRQKLLSINPDDMEAHTMLQHYYMDKENWAMSLKHVEVLLKKTPTDAGILETAADLNIKMDRMDRALEYYDYLLALNPNNKTILQKKKDAQKTLAEDLVVLVEHNGSQQLWQDLVQVTSDRSGVYREIASLLRKKNNIDELIEVLTLICLEDPFDDEILAELTALLKEKGRDDELQVLLVQLHTMKQKQ